MCQLGRKVKKLFCVIIIFAIIGILVGYDYNKNAHEMVFNDEKSEVVDLDQNESIDVFYSGENEEILIRTSENNYEIKSIKNIPHGEVLRVVFSNEKTLLLSNTKFLVHIDLENKMTERFIDLTKLDKFDNDRSEVNVDRTGRNIIYSSFNEKENIKNVYYVNIDEGSGIKIGESEIEDFVDGWSYNSEFYVYGDKEGKEIVVFDRNKLEVNRIDFKRDFLKKVLVTDNGEVFVEGNKKYVIKKNKNYELAECVIAGNFVGVSGNDIITYKNGTINNYSDGAIKKINEIPEQFRIVRNINDNIILSDESSTIVYNISENKVHKYSFKYEYLDMIIPNNQGNKCLIKSKRYNNRVIGSNGQYYKIGDTELMKIIGECLWVNDEELMGIYYNSDNKAIVKKVTIRN